MTGRLAWLLSLLRRRLWFRATLFGAAAVAAALVAVPVEGLLPGWATRATAGAPLGELLTILASSMLAVATFSLGTMVQAFGAASSHATPRAARILIDDPISQTALSTFIGAFVFAIVGLIALSLGLYGDAGRALMLVATALVIATVIGTMFGWVDYLANLMRLGTVVDRIEEKAADLLDARARASSLGGRPPAPPPPGAVAIRVERTGYLAHIDLGALETAAAEAGGALHVVASPGALVDPERPVAYASWPADAGTRERLARAFSLAAERSFDQDPRYALVVLTEVASRALSSGVNDPGTAISVISRHQRLISVWAKTAPEPGPPAYPHLHLPPLDAADLFEDAFGPLARDAAGMVEVGVRLQKTLRALAALGRPDVAASAAAQSARALDRAEAALPGADDRARLRDLARAVTAAASCAPSGPAAG